MLAIPVDNVTYFTLLAKIAELTADNELKFKQNLRLCDQVMALKTELERYKGPAKG